MERPTRRWSRRLDAWHARRAVARWDRRGGPSRYEHWSLQNPSPAATILAAVWVVAFGGVNLLSGDSPGFVGGLLAAPLLWWIERDRLTRHRRLHDQWQAKTADV